MIGKILKKGNEPKKVGNMADLDIDNQSVEIAVYLTFPKLEDGVSKRLESKLTIGSEVGDLILSADHGVSSRHCSLIVNARNIVSVIDHSSEAGTYINKKRLDPGKSYFLNENDKLKIGNILAKLEFMEVPALESVRAMEDDQTK